MRRNFKSPDLLSTHQIAKLLGIDSTTVIGWCEKGKILSHKTLGGHRRVASRDLLSFLKNHHMPVPPDLKDTTTLSFLVVDDDPEIRRMIVRVIRGFDAKSRIEEAEDGFSAGQKVIDLLPDLVILDLNLPGLNGFSVCERIRADTRLKNAKILAITGHDTLEAKKKILLAGADDFLPKPFQAKTLKDVIARILKS